MVDLIKVASVGEIEPGKAKIVRVKEEPVAIFNVKGEFYAVHNTCLHKGGPMGEGYVNDSELTVECPWHGWVYSLETGESTFNPSTRLKTYKVKIQNDDILIEA